MLRLFLLTVALITARSCYASFGEIHGLHAAQPKLISETVGHHEVPTKIIRITKTVAIKVPVPYPVKVPHHIPIPVPVNRPVAIPVPQIVKVPHHVPIEVSRPVPVEVHQQVPLIVPRPVPYPQPIPVPHPVSLDRPIYYPVPHPVPYQHYAHEHSSFPDAGKYSPYGSDNDNTDHHESRSYSYYTVDSPHEQSQIASNDFHNDQQDFQPSQPDYTENHH